jgi:hypothetical protein
MVQTMIGSARTPPLLLLILGPVMPGAGLGALIVAAMGMAAVCIGWRPTDATLIATLCIGTLVGAVTAGILGYRAAPDEMRYLRLVCVLGSAMVGALGGTLLLVAIDALVVTPLLPHDRESAEGAFTWVFLALSAAMVGGAAVGGLLGRIAEAQAATLWRAFRIWFEGRYAG